MRLRIQTLLLVFVLVLGSTWNARAETGNPTHDAWAAASQAVQREAFRRVLREASETCSDVSAIFFAGFDEQRTAYWDGRCREGSRYRVALYSTRLVPPGVMSCAALAAGPAGGPCFQAVQPAAVPGGLATGNAADQSCRANCNGQPAGCLARCERGGGAEVGIQAATSLPANSRYGAIYHAELPVGAFGFTNGSTDRLEVNMLAVTACQTAAGRTPCRFEAELVNTCGALAQAIRLSPNALAIGADLRSFLVIRIATGTGSTQGAAEQAAMAQCRRFEGGGVTCRLAAAGC